MIDTLEITEDWKDFELQEAKLIKQYNFRQKSFKEWFDLVQKNHQNIRNKIGGLGCELEIRFENINRSMSNDVFYPIMQEICQLLPTLEKDLLDRYGKSPNALKLPSFSTDEFSTHRMIKSSTFIMNCGKNRGLKSSDLNILAELVSRLGRFYTIYSTKPCDAKIVLSTETIEFLKLGFYKVDTGSCFTKGLSKYYLGQGNDSFVLHYYEDSKHLARMWGSFTSNCEVMNVSNLYMDKGVHEGNILTAAKMLYATIESVELDDIHETHDVYEPSNLYRNGYGTLSFSKNKIEKQTVQFSTGVKCYQAV